MDICADPFPIVNIYNLDYLFQKCLRCVKNAYHDSDRVCKYIEHIMQLSTDYSLLLDHLFYANDIIEYLAENFSTEPKYTHYLEGMLTLCLMPPTLNFVTECSYNLPTLIRFYDVMAKCIWLVHEHAELNILLFGVIQSSLLRRQSVPENSVDLRCCHEAVGMSDLPKTLMELVGKATTLTFLDDLLKLSYNVATVSNTSALNMMQSDGVRILVDTLKPNFLWMPLVSFERFTVCEFVIMLLNRMFSAWSELRPSSSGTCLQPPRVSLDTLEIVLCNIEIETKRNDENSMKLRNDFCCVLDEIVDNCSIDDNEYSEDFVTDIVMLCVWPEIIQISHWLDDVTFYPVNENFIFKSLMLDIVNKVFINNLSSKIEFQKFNTYLIKEFITLLNVEYSKNIYGDNLHTILSRLLLYLPYLLLNSVDCSIKTACCNELLALIKSLQEYQQSFFYTTMVKSIICIGIVSNDDFDMLRKFKSLKADILINSVILDTLKTQDYDFQDIRLYGLNTLNVFFRENQQNPEAQPMIFNMVMNMLEVYFVEDFDRNINQNILLDLLHFIKNAIIRYNDQVELFVKAEGIEHILNALPTSKYPIQLVMLTTLVDLAVFKSAKCHIKKWRSAKTGKSYLELVCEIWRREKVRFNFIDDEYVFQEQRDATTAKNLASLCSPVVESMFMCAQPKIYLLVHLVEFTGSADDRLQDWCIDEPDNDIEERTIRACSLVSGLQDKATVAHIYHYYSLKLGEVWNENDIVAKSGDVEGVEWTPIISQSVDAMAARHTYLTALITMIKSRVTDLHSGESEIEIEKKLYEEIRHYNNYSKAHLNISSVTQSTHITCNENHGSVTN